MILLLSSQLKAQDLPSYEKTLAVCREVQDPDRQVGNYNGDSIPNLPIGLTKEISGTKYIIAIDSAYFLPGGAYFSAYMALDFPGADKKLAFAIKDVRFNPKGVVGGEQAKLVLVSDHIIRIGPNIKMHLPSDGSNFVRWGCNGFESVNLKGQFIFSKGLLEPIEETGDTAVYASFETKVTDMQNMITKVDFSPFQIRGMDDYSFSISSATVDMSDFANPPGVVLPPSYREVYGDDILLWRGFYLQDFSVKLPGELGKGDDQTQIYAHDMFIDNSGVTGFFGATELFSTSEGEMDGKWGFSVDRLEIGLTSNKLTSGALDGEIGIPALDNNTLNYNALIIQNPETERLDYSFAVNPEKPMSMNAFNATLTLEPTSVIAIQKFENKFRPKAILNGNISLDNKNLKLRGLRFEYLTLVTERPFITDGLFSLVSEESNSAANFPIQLSEVMFGVVDLKPVFGCNIALNLGKADSPNNFSIATSVRVYANIEKDFRNKYRWSYDRFQLNDVLIEMHTNAFYLDGLIAFHDEDPVYGSGFYGMLAFGINGVMNTPITMACAFGKLPTYKYWMVDVTVPVLINVTSQIQINSLSGGIAYHMLNSSTNKDLISAAAREADNGGELNSMYVPDEDAGLFFKAGVGLRHTANEQIFNGDVIFSIGFNAAGGLSFVQFEGLTYSLCKRAERATAENYVKAHTLVNYDHNAKIFNAQLACEAQFVDAIYANVWSQIYLSPEHWHFHIGTPNNPGTVEILDFAKATSYFMMGQDLPPMPPPPPQVSAVFESMKPQRDVGAAASGKGVATGFNLTVGFEDDIGFKSFMVYGSGYVGCGFDMSLYKYADGTHCAGGDDEFGMNNWYLQGQLYSYLSIKCGIAGKLAGKEFDVNLLEANAALLLQGKMPKPTYVYGGIHLDAKVLSVIDVNMTFDFDMGTDCEIVSG